MKYQFLSALALTALALAAPAKVTLDIQGAFPSPVTCEPDQELVVLKLTNESPTLFDKKALPFQGPFTLALNDGSPVSGIRLEVCTDENLTQAVFKRIIRRVPSVGAWTMFRYDEITSESLEPNAGLTAAIYMDVKSLHMEFPNEKDPARSLLLKGHVDQAGQQLITLSTYNSKASSVYKLTNEFVEAGLFVEGDPFVKKGIRSYRRINLGGVQVTFDLKYTGSKGNYLDYNFTSFRIEDSHTQFAYSGGEKDSHLKIQYSHHGLSDAFWFVFQDVEYRLTPGFFEVIRKTQTPAEIEKFETGCDTVHLCGESLL